MEKDKYRRDQSVGLGLADEGNSKERQERSQPRS